MNGLRGAAVLTMLMVLLSACSWWSETAGDDAGATSAPSPSVGLVPDTAPPAAVAGRVEDSAGRPVRRALVTLTAAEPSGPPVPDLAVMTGEDGKYSWPHVVPSGRYRVSVSTDQGSASVTVVVKPSTTASGDLTLAR
jgi:hypothetical protein